MPTPTLSQLAHCIAQLTRFIPTPPSLQAKEQQSKFGLKVGQLLESPAGELFTVAGTDSLGLTLETPDGKCARLTNRDELAHYTKVRAVKAKKVSRRRGKAVPDSSGSSLNGTGNEM